VLDRIAQQVGARWSTVYAVFDSKADLPKLRSTLSAGQKLDERGWKTIAPGPELDLPGNFGAGNFPGAAAGAEPVRIPFPSGAQIGEGGPGRVITATEDEVVRGSAPKMGANSAAKRSSGAGEGRMVRVMQRRGADGTISTEQESWSPIQIILPTNLVSKLNTNYSAEPSFESAKETAKQVKGRVSTYYVLRQSRFNMGGFAGLPMGKPRIITARGTNGPALEGRPLVSEDLETAVRQQKLDDLGKLTAEQRVQRARSRQAVPQR
jgi:hypothetical protein